MFINRILKDLYVNYFVFALLEKDFNFLRELKKVQELEWTTGIGMFLMWRNI